MEFGDCLVGVKNEDCEGNATKSDFGVYSWKFQLFYKQPNVLCYFSSYRKWHFLATELLGGHVL